MINHSLQHEGNIKYNLSLHLEDNYLSLKLSFSELQNHQTKIKTYSTQIHPQLMSEQLKEAFHSHEGVYNWLQKRNNFEVDLTHGQIILLRRHLIDNQLLQERIPLELQKIEECKKTKSLEEELLQSFQKFREIILQFYFKMGIWARNIEFLKKTQNFETKGYDYGEYRGQLLSDQRHGIGFLNYENGVKEEGQWQNDLLNGRGKKQFQDGTYLLGEFKDGLPHGLGIEFYENGEYRMSQYKDGKLHGKSIYDYMGGQSEMNHYIDGKILGNSIIKEK